MNRFDKAENVYRKLLKLEKRRDQLNNKIVQLTELWQELTKPGFFIPKKKQ